jgi:hypothetical protein
MVASTPVTGGPRTIGCPISIRRSSDNTTAKCVFRVKGQDRPQPKGTREMSTRSSRRAPSSTVANSQWVKRAGPRSVRVWNDRSRKWELFENVSVSNRAVVEWLQERWASVGGGNPNRPPDTDMAKMRGWDGAGDDYEGMTPAGCLIEGDIDLAEGLIARPIHPDGSTVRIGITRLDAGYLVKCRIRRAPGSRLSPGRSPPAQQWPASPGLWTTARLLRIRGPTARNDGPPTTREERP